MAEEHPQPGGWRLWLAVTLGLGPVVLFFWPLGYGLIRNVLRFGEVFWFAVGILAMWGVVWLIFDRPAHLRRTRAREGRCVRCGYDLRATPGRCPECGAEKLADLSK